MMIVCTREYCATPFFRYYDHRVLLLGFLLFCPFCVPFLSPLVPPVPIGTPDSQRFVPVLCSLSLTIYGYTGQKKGTKPLVLI